MGRPKKAIVPAVEPQEIEENQEFSEVGDTRDFAAYDITLRDYLSTAGNVKDYTATLYKYDNQIKGKQFVCDVKHNEMISMHDVGVSFGSGEYRYLVSFPPETHLPPKAFRFNIHKVYDKYGGSATAETQRPQVSSFNESLAMLKAFAEIIKGMMPPPPPPPKDPFEIMTGAYQATQHILKRNLEETSQIMKEAAEARAQINNNNDDDDDEKGGSQEKIGMLQLFMPMIEKYIPLLLGKGSAAEATAETIKALPQFQDLIKNKSDLQAVVKAVESKIGKKETAEILEKLSINRP